MPLISQAHIPGGQISPLTIYVPGYWNWISIWIQFHRSIELRTAELQCEYISV